MKVDLRVVVLAVFACIAACGTNDPGIEYPYVEEFAFCVADPEVASEVKKTILSVARSNAMTVNDRSAEVRNELENVGAEFVLKKMNGAPIMLTIERQNYLKIFLSNVGSGKEMTLSARYVSSSRPGALEGLIEHLGSQFELRPFSDGRVPARCG